MVHASYLYYANPKLLGSINSLNNASVVVSLHTKDNYGDQSNSTKLPLAVMAVIKCAIIERAVAVTIQITDKSVVRIITVKVLWEQILILPYIMQCCSLIITSVIMIYALNK